MTPPVSPDGLRRFPLFGQLPDGPLGVLAAACSTVSLQRGEMLFRRGEAATACYGVVSGVMELSMSNAEGVVKVVEVIGPGETLAEAVIFLGRRYPVTATALAAAEVVRIPAGVVDRMLDSEATFARALLASMAVRLHSRVKDIEMYTLRSARQRLAAYLLDRRDPDTGRAPLTPSKQVVASRLGMTPETLSRAVRDLAEAGVVLVRGRVLVIPDPHRLSAHVA